MWAAILSWLAEFRVEEAFPKLRVGLMRESLFLSVVSRVYLQSCHTVSPSQICVSSAQATLTEFLSQSAKWWVLPKPSLSPSVHSPLINTHRQSYGHSFRPLRVNPSDYTQAECSVVCHSLIGGLIPKPKHIDFSSTFGGRPSGVRTDAMFTA